ncbi:MAG: response regulator [Candidatus Zixiibacteriota bacterium]
MTSELNILVVDDDAYLLDLLIETLTTIGYDAIGAPNAVEALKMLETSEVNLIITDIKMPQMDGIEFARTIRRTYPDLPIVFISGAFTPSVLRQIEGEPYIPKPFRINQIEKIIEDVANRVAMPVKSKPGDMILVVDDDDSFRLMLIESLKLSGYTVAGVGDGISAVERIKKGGISAVITDVKMPGMDGISLAKYIHKQWPGIPVVLITAYLNFDEVPDMERQAADGYLMKPFKIEAVTSLLKDLGKDASITT